MKVLVADDSQPIRERLVSRLSRLPDVLVVEAVDTTDALRQMITFKPDVAVLDIRMPGGGGIKALTEIKKNFSGTTVIVMTNYPYAQYRRKCLDEGADFFFDKSSEFELVAETIRQLMQSLNVGEVALRTAAAQLVAAKEEIEKKEQRLHDMGILSLLHKPFASDSLDQAYAMWEKTFDAMPDMVSIFDAGRRVVRVNKALADRLGVPAAELTGKKCYECIHNTDCPVEKCPHGQMQTDGQEHSTELYEERLGGWFDVSVSPIYENGQMIGVIHIARDITEKKNAEAMIRHACDIAETANLAKTQFMANMSHELRTPLNAIIGLTELLEDSKLDAEQLDYIRTISASGEVLLRLVSDLLDLSRIELGKIEMRKETFNIREVIGKGIALISRLAEKNGLKLTCVVEETVPQQITGDPSRLQQVLVNLLNNALKFTEKGFVRLTVRGRLTPAGSRIVEFFVEDSGEGIDAVTMKRLFQPFQQGDSSSTRAHGGVGLGLAISKNLVEMMGGTIRVESRRGEGALFSFYIVDQAAP
ncbi:MAG: ATP-binding protein [Kiritimatiellales bacterium]